MRSLNYSDLNDEHLSRILPAYFFITTRQRNAWWGTKSRQYRGPASLTCSLNSAKKVAESWRAQGSAFSIQKVPGLHVMSEWTDIGIVEFHTDDSFSTWHSTESNLIAPGRPLPAVLDALGPHGPWRGIAPSSHSFVSGVLEPNEVAEPIGKRASFSAWRSYSEGGGYMLGWIEQHGRHKAAGVRRIARLATRAPLVDRSSGFGSEEEE